MERLERKGMERKGKAGLGERAGRDPGRKAGKGQAGRTGWERVLAGRQGKTRGLYLV